MAKYRIRPDDVDAEEFTGDNWQEIESWLGPHLTKIDEDADERTDFFVFDISTKTWKPVRRNFFVVKDATGSLSVLPADEFNDKWVPVPLTIDQYLPGTPGRYPPFTVTNG